MIRLSLTKLIQTVSLSKLSNYPIILSNVLFSSFNGEDDAAIANSDVQKTVRKWNIQQTHMCTYNHITEKIVLNLKMLFFNCCWHCADRLLYLHNIIKMCRNKCFPLSFHTHFCLPFKVHEKVCMKGRVTC